MNVSSNALLSGFQAYGLRSAQGPDAVNRRDETSSGSPDAQRSVGDSASISDAAREALAGEKNGGKRSSGGDDELTPEQEETVRELQARDREVRTHEQAHKAAAGDLATGGPTYTYQNGPDGRRYAIGGEVQIQLRPGKTPEETVRNMERARRAALAPAEPSGPDRAVAAKASQLAAQARAEANSPEAKAAENGTESEEIEAQLGFTSEDSAAVASAGATAESITRSAIDLLA